uniref:Uncharacterized protein n=1 Tax=Lactuca sativa TaxID=4236 RepID=A0A9R1W787_LACSA|nr:hypothetical protein LSAT_V11C300101880 [Lactuca sativa]
MDINNYRQNFKNGFRTDEGEAELQVSHTVIALVSDLRFLQGTAGETGLIPVYPTLTFPNHYSIAIGLYPTYHGIILNRFTDPTTGDNFTTRSREPKWWLGEPIWETIANQGLKAVTYFWPGSDVKKGSWDCPVNFCPPYNASVPFEERVDTFLHYFDLPNEEIPAFMALYLEDHDSQGHLVGPDDPQITEAVSHIDGFIYLFIFKKVIQTS